MKLNADMGESYGMWQQPFQRELMQLVDQCNIACGYHAGDPIAIQSSITLAKEFGVSLGAHPSYPDLQGFGRRSMAMSDKEIYAMVQYQVAALQGMARAQSYQVDYVKPHGALYNDMVKTTSEESLSIFSSIASCLKDLSPDLSLMTQGLADMTAFEDIAQHYNVTLIQEAFVDRAYMCDGRLMPRRLQGAVLTHAQALEQARRLIDDSAVVAEDGSVLRLNVQSLCVHGDNPDALSLVTEIRNYLDRSA